MLEHLDSIHFRHHMIDQQKLIGMLADQFQSFCRTKCRIDLKFCILCKSNHDLQINLIIIYNQDPGILCMEGLLITDLLMKLFFIFLSVIPDLFFIYDLLSNRCRKCGTFTIYTADCNISTHCNQQILGDRKSQACTFN